MGRKKFIFISIIILFTIQTSACSAEGQEGQGIWHNEYESEIEISSTEEERKDVSENENITFRVLDGKEISVSRDAILPKKAIFRPKRRNIPDLEVKITLFSWLFINWVEIGRAHV